MLVDWLCRPRPVVRLQVVPAPFHSRQPVSSWLRPTRCPACPPPAPTAAGRLMRCLFEVCMRRGWAALTDKALMLSKCVMRRQWGSQTPLRQFKGIPTEILSKVG